MVPVLKEPTVPSNDNVAKFNEHLLWAIQCNDIGLITQGTYKDPCEGDGKE